MKNKLSRRLLAGFMVLCMVVLLLPTSAFASTYAYSAYVRDYNNNIESTLTWTYDDVAGTGRYYTWTTPTTTANLPTDKVLIGWKDNSGSTWLINTQISVSNGYNYYPITVDKNVSYVVFKDTDGTMYSYSQVDNNTITVPANPTKTGYTFVGWDRTGDGQADTVTTTNFVSGGTYTALWTVNSYSVTDGTDATATATPGYSNYNYGATASFTVTPAAGYTVDTVSVKGNTSGTSYAVGTTNGTDYTFTMPAENVTIYVTTTADEYTITFIADGNVLSTAQYAAGATVTAPAAPAKTGYTFGGWDAGNDGVADTVVTPAAGNATYTAIYAAVNNLTVSQNTYVDNTLNAALNAVSIGTGTYATGDTVTVTVTVPTGYTLNSVTAVDADGAAVALAAKSVNGNIYTYTFTMPGKNVTVNTYLNTVPAGTSVVQFVTDGGVYASKTVTKGATYTLATAPTKAGYTFNGWSDGANVRAVNYTATLPADAADTVTWTATWTANVCTVTYNDGADVQTITGTTGGTYTAPAAPTGVTGFVSWVNQNGEVRVPGTTYTFAGDETLTAVTNAQSAVYMVKFVDVDGSLYSAALATADNGYTYTLPVVNNGDGYTYQWTVGGAYYNGNAGTTLTAAGDTTVTLVRTAVYETLTTNVVTDDGTNQQAAVTTATSNPTGTTVTATIVVPTGYYLNNVVAAGQSGAGITVTQKSYDAATDTYTYTFTMPGENATLTVYLNKIPAGSSAVEFVTDDGLYAAMVVTRGTNYTAPAAAPTAEGKTFTGWKNGTTTIQAGDTVLLASDAASTVIWTAQWDAVTYNVTYNENGGTPEVTDNLNIAYNATLNLAAAPTLAGSTFMGWKDGNTGITYGAGALYTVTHAVIMTAVWVKDAYTVRFVDSLTGVLYSYQVVENGTAVTTPAAPTNNPGYTFKYWQDTTDPTVQYAAGVTITAAAANKTYQAVWEVNTHSIGVSLSNATYGALTPGLTGVAVGETVSFKAMANPDYALSSVTITYNNGTATVTDTLTHDATGVYSFTMPNANVALSIIAKQNVFSIFTTPDANSAITAGATSAAVGDNVTFTVRATSADYTVSNVYVEDGNGNKIPVTAVITGAFITYNFTMPESNVTIFSQSTQNAYTVTFVDEDNTLLGTAPVNSGEALGAAMPTAPTKAGYTFAGWVTVPGGTAFDGTTLVTGDLTVKATYTGDAHTIALGTGSSTHVETVTVNTNGNTVDLMVATTPTVESATGKIVTVTIAAEYNYEVTGLAVRAANGSSIVVAPTLNKQWTGADNLTYYSYTFTMPANDLLLEVYTAPKTFEVGVTEVNGQGGTFRVNGVDTTRLDVGQGTEVTVAVTPEAGYVVESIVGTYTDKNGNPATVIDTDAADNTLTFTMVGADVSVVITYKATAYGINVTTSNTASYKPYLTGNDIYAQESIDTAKTSMGKITINGVTDQTINYSPTIKYYIPDNGTANVGDKIYFTVTEYTGYDLNTLKVSYNDGSVTHYAECPLTSEGNGVYSFVMPAADVTITATYIPETYTVTKTANSEINGDVVLTYNGVDYNDYTITSDYKGTVTVTATPDAGYYVKSITYTMLDGTNKDGVTKAALLDFSAGASYTGSQMTDTLDTAHALTFTMPACNVSVSVTYAKINYSVTTTAVDTNDSTTITDETGATVNVGTITVTTPQQVNNVVKFTVTPVYGYTLQDLVITDANGKIYYWHPTQIDSTNGGSFYFTMPASAVNIKAVFVEKDYTVYYYDWQNNVVATEGVNYMDNATLSPVTTAISCPTGYHFVGWASADIQTPIAVTQLGGTTFSNTATDFVVYKNTKIYAIYQKDEIDVTFAKTTNGTVTADSINTTALTPAATYTTGDTTSVTLDTTVWNDKVTFTATPAEGYQINTVAVTYKDAAGADQTWYATDITSLGNGQYSFLIPNTFKTNSTAVNAGDVTVTVTFAKLSYTLTKEAGCETNGTVSINGLTTTEKSYTFDYLDMVTIAATPDAGYYVAGITATRTNAAATDTQDAANGYSYTYTGTKPAVDSASGPVATITFPMPATNMTYTVDYEKCDYSIDTATSNAATTAVNEGQVLTTQVNSAVPTNTNAAIAQIGDKVTLTVTEDYGYDLATLKVTYMQDGVAQTLILDPVALTAAKTQLANGSATSTYTFVMPANAVTVTATFTEETWLVVKDATCESNGIVSADGLQNVEGSYAYNYLDTATVTVTPDSGWYVTSITATTASGTALKNYTAYTAASFTDNGYDGPHSISFTMPAENVTIHATYARIAYTIDTATSNTVTEVNADQGQVLTTLVNGVAPADPDAATAKPGDKVTLTVTEDYGYDLATLKVTYMKDGVAQTLILDPVAITAAKTQLANGSATSTYSFIMPDQPVTVTATFTEETWLVVKDATCESNGIVSADGLQNVEGSYAYNYLDTANVTVTPDSGWYVTSITATTASGTALKNYTAYTAASFTDNSYDGPHSISFTMPAENVTIHATYARIAYTIDTATSNTVTEVNADQGQVLTTKVDGVAPAYTNAATAKLGDVVTLTVTEDYGYDLQNLTVTTDNGQTYLDLKQVGSKVENTADGTATWTVTFVMPERPVVVTATFVKEQYQVIKGTGSEANGAISVPDGIVWSETGYYFDYNKLATVTVTPETGWYVTSITAIGAETGTSYGTIAPTLANPGTGKYDVPHSISFTMPAENVTISVTYAQIGYDIDTGTSNTITTSANPDQGYVMVDKVGTTANTDKSSAIASVGDIVTLKTVPMNGYTLDTLTVTYNNGKESCTLTGVGDNTFTFTMPATNVTVTATFKELSYTATLTKTGNGYVALDGYYTNNMGADYMDLVTVTVKPDAGWELKSITVDGGKVAINETITAAGGDYTFTMPARDVNVAVTLVQTGFTITNVSQTVKAEGTHGAVVTDPASIATVGQKVTLTANPDDGYRVKSISVIDNTTGQSVPVSFVKENLNFVRTYSFTMPAGNVTATVVFEVRGSAYYTDVRTDDWFNDAVTFVTDRGYVNGKSADTFAPNDLITRAEFVTILGRMAGIDVSAYASATSFTDVNTSAYYAPYVAWATQAGIVKGYDAATFGTNDNITREQMFAMVYRYCMYLGCSATVEHPEWMANYTDLDQISSYAYDSLTWCVSEQVAHGMTTTTIDPQGTATRAQAVQMIMNLCDHVLFP